MKTKFYKRPVCHICGFRIPDLVNVNHPMAGTIDHIQPRALGGLDTASNRAPAHRYCNLRKAQQEMSEQIQAGCAAYVAAYLEAHPHLLPPKKSRRSARRNASFQQVVSSAFQL